ncbi:MAG: hypothetical protein FWH02_07525 [Oscillospiraceae bacterium]|nr:hypothetical protein [Oscillospiraceae bacterium]
MPGDDKKAKARAREVNELSLKHHLSHALAACNSILKKESPSLRDDLLIDLDKRMRAALQGKTAYAHLIKEKAEICSAFENLQIYVGYLKSAKQSGYTVYEGGKLVIYLPEGLLEKAVSKGSYQDPVKELRKLMAHELGHAILHTKDIMRIKAAVGGELVKDGKAGSALLKDEKESEAKVFGTTLLDLRHKRNMQMIKDGTLVKFF